MRISPTIPSTSSMAKAATIPVISGIQELNRRTVNPSTSSPTAVSQLVNNSSITITQTNKRPTPNVTVKPQMVNNNVTISPIINPNSTVQLVKSNSRGTASNTSTVMPLVRPVSKASPNVQTNKSNSVASVVAANKPGGQMVATTSTKPTTTSASLAKTGNAARQNQIQIAKVATISPVSHKSVGHIVPKTNAQQRNIIVNAQTNRTGSPLSITKAAGNATIRPVIVQNASQSNLPPALTRLSQSTATSGQGSSQVVKAITPAMNRVKAPTAMVNRSRTTLSTTPGTRSGIQLSPVNSVPLNRKRPAQVGATANSRVMTNLIPSSGISITQVKRPKIVDNSPATSTQLVRAEKPSSLRLFSTEKKHTHS